MSGISPISISKEPPLILVADDDQTIRFLLREAMEKEGYRVAEVSDGQQCLDTFTTLKPDLVLLDAMMPSMDGFSCCQQMVQIAKNLWLSTFTSSRIEPSWGNNLTSTLCDHTPILMITGLDDPESVDRAFAAGASDYVTKPIHWPVLRQRVRRLLQQAQLYQHLEATNRALQKLVHVDSLTSIANRRHFDQYLNAQWLSLGEKKASLSLILCDIDFFKLYNDKYGHLTGDLCLQKVATVLSRTVQRNQDLVARYGGEEFAVVMPYTHAPGAVHIAAALQAGVRELRLTHAESTVSHYVTLSLGVATTIPNVECSPTTLIMAADQALYQAKEEGRNRIILKQINC